MEFETILKVIVMAAAAIGIPVGAYAAVAATRVIWARPADPRAEELARLRQELEAVGSRIADLEAQQGRLLELEERLDFTERMLAQRPTRELRRGNTPPESHAVR
jgi:hypothetical protein